MGKCGSLLQKSYIHMKKCFIGCTATSAIGKTASCEETPMKAKVIKIQKEQSRKEKQ